MKEVITRLKCLRCGYEWYPLKPQKPKRCTWCNSKLWETPKK